MTVENNTFNYRSRIETLTQFTEWSQFMVDYFFSSLHLLYWGLSHQTLLAMADDVLQQQAIYSSVTQSRDDMTSQLP